MASIKPIKNPRYNPNNGTQKYKPTIKPINVPIIEKVM